MNHRAASGGVSNTLTTRVHSKLPAINPQRFKFPQVLQSLAVGPFRSGFYSKWATSRVNGPQALPAPTRISPAPTTEQKQN